MHLNTTEEMNRASDVLTPYMQYTPGEGWNVKPNAPKKIKKLQETSRALWNEMTEVYYAYDCMQSVEYTKEKGFEVRSDAPEKIKNLHRTLQELLEQIQNNTILEQENM